MIITAILLFLLAGAAAGLLAGLFGIGGGVIVVPLLAEIFTRLEFTEGIVMHLAIGTSLATMMFTATIATVRHHQNGGVKWHIVKMLAPPLLVGAFCGPLIADLFNTSILQKLFAGFLVFTAINIVMTFHSGKSLIKLRTMKQHHHMVMGGVIGTLAGLLGIGGGVLTVPWLIQAGYDSRIAAGCSSACTLIIAISGVLGTLVAGANETGMPDYSLGFIYLPAVLCVALASSIAAPLGVHLSYRLPQKIVGSLFALMLLGIALRLILL